MSEGNAKMGSMLGKRNEARRKAEAKALFSSMLKAPHMSVVDVMLFMLITPQQESW